MRAHVWFSINLKGHMSLCCSLASRNRPLAPQIKFKSLTVAHRVTSVCIHQINSVIQAWAPSRTLCSCNSSLIYNCHLYTRQSQSVDYPQRWRQLPNAIRAWASLSGFKSLLKASLLQYSKTLTCLTDTNCALLYFIFLHFVLLNSAQLHQDLR